MEQRPGEAGATRRRFMQLLGVAGTTAAVGTGASAAGDVEADDEHPLGELSFYSTASQIAADGQSELTDDDVALVRAAETAVNVNREDSSDDAIIYENAAPPLVSKDGGVYGIGTVELVADGNNGFEADTEQFLLNCFEEEIGSEGTIAWDESHDQFWNLDQYSTFSRYAADEGFDLRPSPDLLEGTASLTVPSTASQVTPSGDGPLTDEESILVWAEPTAENVDNEGDGAYIYEDEPIPLVSKAGNVVGFGSPDLFSDGNLGGANEQFLLNLLADVVEPEGTILWDDGHDTAYDSSGFTAFADTVEGEDYTFEATTDIINGDDGTVDQLEFFSTAALVADDGTALTDDSLVAVWAEDTAYTNGDVYRNSDDAAGDGAAIPLVAVDGAVVGVGSDLASDGSSFDANREFLVNAWEDRLGGTGTVLYDESHGQNLTLSENFSQLQTAAEARGFTVETIGSDEDFAARLDDGDAVMIASDDDDLASGDGFTDAELDALSTFVADGGGLFVHDTSDFEGDSTGVLNDVADAVGTGFRFASNQVSDDENNDGRSFVPRTTNFNDGAYPDFFQRNVEDPVTIEDADLVAVASPSQAYSDAELDALQTHVRDGGALFLFDESEFTNEETANLNAIANELVLPFSFNPDQVEDAENNTGQSFIPTTANYNDAFDLFDGLTGVGLDEADALAVTTPPSAFTDEELTALSSFVDDGGALFLFDQSEFNGFEETANLNAIADQLDLAFRFNGDQVEDEQNNTGSVFDVTTTNYDPSDPRFQPRDNGIGIDFEPGGRYPGRVVEIADGDTFNVQFQDSYGQVETIRHLGIDTAETGNTDNELNKWFGIEDGSHVDEWGTKATEYALERMAPEGGSSLEPIEGRQVMIEIDENAESARGNFGRLLAYVYYDPENFEPGFEEDTFDANYNREIVEDGYARVYSSGFANHDEWARAEARALAKREDIWSAADFQNLSPERNDPVETAFVPRAEAITAADGPLPNEHAIVTGSDTAEADVEEDSPALVAIDEDRRVGAVGGLFLREDYYESGGEDYPEPTGTQSYPLAANLIEYLSEGIGPVLIDGGHGQFEADGAVGLEDAQFFAQYLERIGTRLRQVNDLPETLDREPVRPRAVIITPPADPYTDAEIEALRSFRNAGGAVLLVGSALADDQQRSNLNDLAAALNTDLRVSGAQVTDADSNVGGDAALVTTSAFDDSVPLYDPATFAGDHVTTYLRALADGQDRVGVSGLQTAVTDWQNDDIDTQTLLAVLDAWSQGTRVF